MQKLENCDYTQYRQLNSTISGKDVTFTTKPGIENWDSIQPSESLITDLVHFHPGANVILIGSRHGSLPAALAAANPSVKFTCIGTNLISIQCLNQTITNNNLSNVKIHQYPLDPPLSEESFQIAIILIPKGRSLARRLILECLRVLNPGGSLFIGGATNAGVQSIIKDASILFASTEVLGYKKGERVAHLSKKADDENFLPVWAGSDGVAPGTWLEFEIGMGEENFHIRSLPGVFSSDHLDEGTELLLSYIQIPDHARVLDIGCGYGIIGMVIGKKQKDAQVDMIDVDLLSIAASAENIPLNALSNVRVFPSDLFSACIGEQYQLIVSNPPFHAGKATNYIISEAMVEQAHNHLVAGGEFTLVANRFLRYEKQMEKYFSRVTITAQTNKYHIITGVR